MGQPGSKPYEISKQVVAAAFEKVRSKKGAPGVDGVTVEQFAQDYKNNLYKLWNRMSSGSYFPSPVRMVEIPKSGGRGTRVLGVPTVADRTAQSVAVAYLEPLVEKVFHPDSYGYRPGRSPLDAVETCRARCFEYAWVLDLDIEGFFDNLDHDLILKAVAHHTDEKWILMYVQRWLTAPLQQTDGTLAVRGRGSSQGASISPLLANLFMHYAFDSWMAREFPHVPFERFVDDVIVHCVSEQQARRVQEAIAARLGDWGIAVASDQDPHRLLQEQQSTRTSRQGDVRLPGLHVQTAGGEEEGRDDVHGLLSGDQREGRQGDPAGTTSDAVPPAQRPVLRGHRQDDQRQGRCVGRLLRAVPTLGNSQGAVPHRPVPGAVGAP